ncbi:10533_t:CDS:2, partial [Scutellospora calospora]
KKTGVFYLRIFGTEPIQEAELLSDKLNYDCCFQKTRLEEFFLCLPMLLEIRSENQAPLQIKIKEGILVLDLEIKIFATGYLPFGLTQKMVKRANRRIRSKTARAMLEWSHYRFKQRLINKTKEYPWCKVIICDEHYTSKTCRNYRYLHKRLGSNKTFKCSQYQIEIDRDINATRNILL